MATALINNVQLIRGVSQEYLRYITEFQKKCDGLQLGYISGNIKHYYHGKKINRNYINRQFLLVKYQFDPYTFLTTDSTGLIIPTEKFHKNFTIDIYNYFKMRNDDDEDALFYDLY